MAHLCNANCSTQANVGKSKMYMEMRFKWQNKDLPALSSSYFYFISAKCVIQRYVSLSYTMCALKKLFSTEVCSFRPHSSCSSFRFALNFRLLQISAKHNPFLALESCTRDWLLAPSRHHPFFSLSAFLCRAALGPWAFSRPLQTPNHVLLFFFFLLWKRQPSGNFSWGYFWKTKVGLHLNG